MFKFDLESTLTFFGKVNIAYVCFCNEKCYNIGFLDSLELVEEFDIKVGIYSQLNVSIKDL